MHEPVNYLGTIVIWEVVIGAKSHDKIFDTTIFRSEHLQDVREFSYNVL